MLLIYFEYVRIKQTQIGRAEQEEKATHEMKFASVLFRNRYFNNSPEGEICVSGCQHTYKVIQKH